MSEAAEDTTVTIERKGEIAILWLDRPDVLNAISHEVKKGIAASVEALDRDDEVRAIILAGRGRAFCAGADRKLLAELEGAGRAARIETLELGAHLSGSRANGLHAMVQRIQAFARAYQDATDAAEIAPETLSGNDC